MPAIPHAVKFHPLHHHHAHGACQCGSPLLTQFHERMMADISRRQFIGGMAGVMAMFAALHAPSILSQQPKDDNRPMLLKNLRLFDGSGGPLRDGVAIRIQDGRIQALLTNGTDAGDAEIIDCGGRVVMPGLIDAHWHTTLAGISQLEAMTADPGLRASGRSQRGRAHVDARRYLGSRCGRPLIRPQTRHRQGHC